MEEARLPFLAWAWLSAGQRQPSAQGTEGYLGKSMCSESARIVCCLRLTLAELDRYRMTPHPVEYDMYYSC